jgi:hypothetical protein
MRKSTNKLQVGDVMASGETVIRVVRETVNKKKIAIRLRKPDGRERTVLWNRYGTVFMAPEISTIDDGIVVVFE